MNIDSRHPRLNLRQQPRFGSPNKPVRILKGERRPPNGRMPTLGEHSAHLVVSQKVQEWCLLQADAKGPSQAFIKDGVPCLVLEVGQNDRVFVGELEFWMRATVENAGESRDNDNDAVSAATTKRLIKRFRSPLPGSSALLLKAGSDFRRILKALLALFLQAPLDYLFDGRRRQTAQGFRLAVLNGIVQDSLGLAGEGALAGGHLVQHQAEGEDVGARVERLAAYLLGRHVSRRAQLHAGAGEVGFVPQRGPAGLGLE